MNDIILYSTHCPICNLLETKMKNRGIKYEVNTNEEEMKNLGFTTVPILKVGNQYLKAQEALKYIEEI